jgi:hypothetical protein
VLARQDERGKFSATEIREWLSRILGRRVEVSSFTRHLAAFCDEERGQVIRKSGKPRRFQYQFVDAPLQPFIVLTGKKDGRSSPSSTASPLPSWRSPIAARD